jgi:hypothetical protein
MFHFGVYQRFGTVVLLSCVTQASSEVVMYMTW